MPVFNYKALKEDGKAENGVIDADSPKEARTKLRAKKLHVTTLETIEKDRDQKHSFISRKRTPRVKHHELSIITRQLGTLLHSGIPLMGAMTAVIEQAENPSFKTVLMEIREKVAQGSGFSDALEAHPRIFNQLYVNMVRAGEAAGSLDQVMYRIADYLYAQNKIRQKILAAITYPAVMAGIGVIVIVILMTFVMPRILAVLERRGGKQALPLPTEIMIFIMNAFETYGIYAGVALIAGVFVFFRFINKPRGRLWWDTFKLKVPVIGTLLRKTAVSRFCFTLSTLLQSGLSVLDSLQVVKRVVQNALLSQTIETVRSKVSEGADIASPIKQSKVFPPVVGYMIAVGEETGELESLLERIAQSYEEEIEIAAQRLTSLLEPIMIVAMAVVVGFMVISVLLPIMQMSRM